MQLYFHTLPIQVSHPHTLLYLKQLLQTPTALGNHITRYNSSSFCSWWMKTYLKRLKINMRLNGESGK